MYKLNSINSKTSFAEGIPSILIIVGLFLVCSFVGLILSVSVVMLWYQVPSSQVDSFFNPFNLMKHPQGRQILYFNQAFTALGGFMLSSYLFLKFFEGKNKSPLNTSSKLSLNLLLLAGLITIVIMPFSSLIVEWNAQMKFPSFLADFERWASRQENDLKKLTIFLTEFSSFSDFLIGLTIIAVIPALGEELLFRGMLQRKMSQFVNIHVAIWLSAIIFSAIHLQFYGFVPRMLLGALFGYFYFWSGNLWTAIFGHFVNNGFTLLMIYLFHQKILNFDLHQTQAMPVFPVIISIVLSSGLLYYFYQQRVKSAEVE
jgi:membrane protease YdiL (CAAX protease family)